MSSFKMVYDYTLPSGHVYLMYNEEKNFYCETTSMQDVDTRHKSEEVLTTNDPEIIRRHLIPIKDKWLIAISTQFGCPQHCQFCLVPTLGFHGNLSPDQMWEQLETAFMYHPEVTECNKIKVGFARMGEPQYNWKNILQVMHEMKAYRKGFTFLPCYNTILPKVTIDGCDPIAVIRDHVMVEKEYLNGFMHVQISTNSTNEDERKFLFGGQDVVTIEEMKKNFNGLPNNNRLFTLNFICGDKWELDPTKLEGLDPKVFCVKLTPLNINPATESHHLQDAIRWNWDNMNKIKEKLTSYGLTTIIDIAAMCELDLCCGNLVQKKILNGDGKWNPASKTEVCYH